MGEATEPVGEPAPELGTVMQYDAFLSYAHRDRRVTVAIHKGLHRIGRRAGRLRAVRVFRDDADLTANPDLWGSVKQAMDRSQFMIVVLSPQAAASYWVNRETEYWLKHRGPDELMLVVAEGKLQWDSDEERFAPESSDAAPPVLTQPKSLPSEPLYIDVSEDAPWDLRSPAFRDKVTALAAPLHGKPKDELASDDLHEQRRLRRLRIAAIVTLVMLTVISAATASEVSRREDALTTVLSQTEQLSDAAGDLYTALSVADAAAATTFYSTLKRSGPASGFESRVDRQRYLDAIRDASQALSRAVIGLTEEPMQQLLARIIEGLSRYTGLIETARANSRAGDGGRPTEATEGSPAVVAGRSQRVGTAVVSGPAYLSEASTLMQQQILPDAQKFFEEISGQADAKITEATRIPKVVLLIVAVTLLCGLYSTRWWARGIRRRRLNIGFAAGGLAVLVMVVWVAAVLSISIAHSRGAKTTDDSLRTITALGIAAQQSRADETVALIRRGDEENRMKAYRARTALMQIFLKAYVATSDVIAKRDMETADELLSDWRQHVAETDGRPITPGNYSAPTWPDFDDLQHAFEDGTKEGRDQLSADISEARQNLTGADYGSVVLAIVAAAAVIAGLWPRMSE